MYVYFSTFYVLKLKSLTPPLSPALFRYMIDSADHEKIEASKNELHSLLDKPQLGGIPVS